MNVSRRFDVGPPVLALLSLLSFAGCGSSGNGHSSSGGNSTPPPEQVDLSTAIPAKFVAHGSIGQVYVTGAENGTPLELLDADHVVVQSGAADAQGTLIFRLVDAGADYVVISRSGVDIQESNEVTVRTADDPPDPSFYESQQIEPGYGYVTVRDGITLAINAILPDDPDKGPYPTVIEYSGYDPANPDSPQPSSLIASALGYAVVGVNMRGTGCSGGAFDFFDAPQTTDGYDVVEIVAAQPWVKGHKVGMVGISYPGITQLFVAQLQPPHLAAITPLSVTADTGPGILYPGGMLNNGFATDWAMDRQHDALPYGQPWSQKRRDEGDQVCIDNQLLRGQAVDLIARVRANPFVTPAIFDPVSPSTFVDRITVPVFLAGAWQDEQVGPYFATMLDRFTGTDKVHFTLINGNHSEPFVPEIFTRWMEFLDLFVAERIPHRPANAAVLAQVVSQSVFGTGNVTLEPERFTDVTSYDEALARWQAEPKVRVLFENGAAGDPGVPGSTFEQSFDAWPIPDVDPTEWYFADGGRLSIDLPQTDGADQFIYDPSTSQQTDFHGGSDGIWKVLPDWDWLPPALGTALAYSTDPLTAPVVMAGSASVDLWLMSTAIDVDVQATLTEVRADGKETYVQTGWLRASHRKLDASRSTVLRPVQTHREADAAPLPTEQFVPMRLEMYPFAHVFHAGSRIRIIISAPGRDRPLWKFEAIAADGEVVNTIAHAPTRPSRIVLPVVPDVPVDTPPPPCPSLRGQPCRDYEPFDNTPG